MKHLSFFLVTVLLVFISCGYTAISPIPDWLAENWDVYNEEGNIIGYAEIDSTKIEFTIYDTERVTFDLIEIMNENFGWTEGTDTSYTVFLDYRSWVSFILYEEYIAVETETSGMDNTMTLRVS